MMTDPVDRATVESINHIGHVMGTQTVAEFVETDAILEELRKMGVDYAQGFSIGKPQAEVSLTSSGTTRRVALLP